MDDSRNDLAWKTAAETSPPPAAGPAGAWTSKKSYDGSIYDARGMERWLAERAAAGDVLQNEWNQFRQGEMRESRFYLEPAAAKEPPDARLREKRARLGWEYVCSTAKGLFYVWRTQDADARTPAPQAAEDSYAYRFVCRRIRRAWFSPLWVLLLLAIPYCEFTFFSALPLQHFLIDRQAALQMLTLFATLPFDYLADAQEQRNRRALKAAMEERVYASAARSGSRWSKAGRGASIACLVLVFVLGLASRSNFGEYYAEPTVPYLSAAHFGGGSADEYNVRTARSLLYSRVTAVGEPPQVDHNSDWSIYSTQLEVYRLTLPFLAAPLSRELRTHYMPEAEPFEAVGFDEALYLAAAGPSRDAGGTLMDTTIQFLLLRRGGCVLFYRTDAPDDLRAAPEEWTLLFDAYSPSR